MQAGRLHERDRGGARWIVVLLLIGLLGAMGVQADMRHPSEYILELVNGDQDVIKVPAEVTRTALGRADVADVQVLDDRTLLVTAQAPGMTSLRIWMDGHRDPRELRVTVLPEAVVGLEGEYHLDQLSARPELAGRTESLDRHAAARQRLGDDLVDSSRQAGAIQVQTDIRVVEVNRRKLDSMGFFFGRNDPGATQFAIGGTANALAFLGGGEVVAPSSGNGGFSIVQANTSGVLTALTALRSNGFAHVLAEPSLVSLSGQSATFLAGGEFPFPSRARDNEVTVEFKEFGVRLQLTPTVLDDDRIMLKVAPEVSELDFGRAVETGGVSVPALNVRRTDTTIQLGDGESFIISGLVSSQVLQNVDRIPGLGDLPVLGALFRATRFERDESELVMIVTPHLVRPMAAGTDPGALPGQALMEYQPSFLQLLFDPEDAADIEARANLGFSR